MSGRSRLDWLPANLRTGLLAGESMFSLLQPLGAWLDASDHPELAGGDYKLVWSGNPP